MPNFTRKEWEKYEKILELYETRPIRYRLKLFFLFFQSFIGVLLLVSAVFLLVRYAAVSPASRVSVRIWILLGVTLGLSLWGYLMAVMNRPWKGHYLLPRKRYPNLYRKVNWISRKVKGPKIHAIYLTHEMNAAVASSFVWIPFLRRNVLMVGYPLLCALSRHAFLGCLAHEIGHLSRKHLSVGAFFYWIHSFWTNLQLGIFSLLYSPWLKFYMPLLERTALPLFRRHEIEADRFSVESFGSEYAAACQVELQLRSDWFESTVVRELLKKMQKGGWTELNVAAFLREELRREIPPEKIASELASAMRRTNFVFDPHPSFRERFALTGAADPMPYASARGDALERFLGNDPAFPENFNRYLHSLLDATAMSMKNRAEGAEQFLRSAGYSPDGKLEEISRVIDALFDSGRKEDAEAFVKACYKAHPEIPEIACRYACTLMENSPDEAAELFEKSLEKCPSLYYFAEEFLFSYYMENSLTDRLKAFLEIREGRLARLGKAVSAELKATDAVSGYVPLPDIAKALREKLAAFKGIDCAYCVERKLEEGSSLSMKFVVVRYRYFSFFSLKSASELLDEFRAAFPDFNFIERSQKYCERNLAPVPNALFYQRGETGKSVGNQ